MQSPGDVIADRSKGAVAERGSAAGGQLSAAHRLGARAGVCSFSRPGAGVRGREESRGERAGPGAAAAAAAPPASPARALGGREERSGQGGWTSGR